MRLDEVHWEDGGGQALEDFSLWGIEPLKEFVQIIDEELDERFDSDCANDKRLWFARYEMEDKLEAMQKAIYRFLDEMRDCTIEAINIYEGGESMAEKHQEEVKQLVRLMKLSERATERGYDVERLLRDIAQGELRGPEDYKRKEGEA